MDSKIRKVMNFPSISQYYEHFGINKDMGFCVDAINDRVPDFEDYYTIAENIPSLKNSYSFLDVIEDLILPENFSYKNLSHNQQVNLFGCLQILAQVHLVCQQPDGWKEYEENPKSTPLSGTLPPQLAIPLYELSKILNTKVSIGFLQCFSSIKLRNQKPIRDLKLDDIDLQYPMTGTETERVFFGINMLAAMKFIYIYDAAYNIYINMQQNNFSQIIQGLSTISQTVYQILKILPLMEKIDGGYFAKNLRKYLNGQKDVTYLGTDFHVTQSPGGSTGNDPSYKFLEYFLGIDLKKLINENQKYEVQQAQSDIIQYSLKINESYALGFTDKHRKALQFAKDCQLREYIENTVDNSLKLAYNNALKSYQAFQSYHKNFIVNYVMKYQKHDNGKGTGGSNLEFIMQKDNLIAMFLFQDVDNQ